MLKYAAHSAYCALICALLLRAEAAALRQATEDSPALLIWFLRAFVSLNLALFCTTLAVFDLLGVCYSQLSDMLRPPPLLKSIWGALAFMLALAANLSVSVAGMWANRVIFGFQLQYELTGATMLLLAYNVANMRYNATSSSRLQSFWHERGLDLVKHQRWSLGLGNIGLSFRLYKRVLVYAASVVVAPAVPPRAALASGWHHPVAWAVGLVVLLTPLTAGTQLLQFHLAHMWLHANATLYRLVHKIHHCARYPIPSDSGTESPLEFMLSKITILNCVVPFVLWLPGEVMAMKWQRAGHDFEAGNEHLRRAGTSALGDGPGFHMLHHTKNVGNLSIEPFDKLMGTLIDASKTSAWVLPAKAAEQCSAAASGCRALRS